MTKVLLVGDIQAAFLDAGNADQYGCVVHANILDAIDAAARSRYDLVGVVMESRNPSGSGQLAAALRALRRSTKARIVLLARMYEEPIARRLAEEESGPERLVDGYVVCPTTLANLCSRVPVEAGGVAVAEDRSCPAALAAKIRHLEWLATTDDLTGLKNRRYIREFTRQILERAKQTAGRVTLLVFDIDNFKHYNDVYGHLTGDAILKQAAILMRRSCRPHDVVARIGGDEFAVIFWDDPHRQTADRQHDRRSTATEHPTEAIFIAKRFRKEFGNAELALLGPEGQGVLTISGGLASFPRDGATVQELFERADSALLDAKRRGKNRIYLVGQPQNDIADM
ncbi:MAG: GGDEF domain-containing protein [Sedimentisphaerales bacterium]|nr:GGDEF domain-containing protein [Sedimentisphaerales bacterium]